MTPNPSWLFRSLCLLGTLAWPLAAPAQPVTIYRCTDAAGKQTLRDTPCPKGLPQQTRDMLRPKDAPMKPAPPPSPKAAPVSVAETTRTVYLAPPRPMYECTTPDGDRYTSEDGVGNPRWVPLWTLGYYAMGRPSRPPVGGNVRPSPQPSGPMRPPPGGAHWPVVGGGGSWIRDQCAMLPPGETCDRVRDRRSAIRTRFFNAQEKERDALRLEERAINARLDNDCGGR